jgi:hypothetical protein
MGKNQHSKDRMFVTATEWARDYGGKKDKTSSKLRRTFRPRSFVLLFSCMSAWRTTHTHTHVPQRRLHPISLQHTSPPRFHPKSPPPPPQPGLPFDHCALSFRPFKDPVTTRKCGKVYDILSIVPYIRKHKVNPVSGDACAPKDLIKLSFHANSEGKFHCPVMYKVFNDNSHIVCIATSGNVYCREAVRELNVKAKNWTDLLTGEKFTKKDIITLQDPADTKSEVEVREKKKKKKEATRR